MLKNWFLSLDFVDDLPRDPITGGDVDIDGTKAHLYDDYISIELCSTFYILHNSIQSREIQLCCLNSQIHKVNIELDF